MDTGADPPRHRRLRKASDLRTAPAYPHPKRIRPGEEHNSCCEDKISSLPDEMLILIIDKLDARTATNTTILSKRWRDLYTHSHTCYDLTVDDILPPRYHRLKQIVVEAEAGYEAKKNALKSDDSDASRDQLYSFKDWKWKVRLLTPILQRYERSAMRRYVKRVNAFLLAPNNVQPRSIQKLRLQACGTSYFTDQWITQAIGRWGVEDLELVIDNSCWLYDFRLLDGCKNVRLKRLVLSNCYHFVAPYSLTFQRLTSLTLCKESSRMSRVDDILRNCVQLVDLRLKDFSCRQPAFHIFVPNSKLKSLQLDNYNTVGVYLGLVPYLETFACGGQPIILHYGVVPRLRHVSLNFLQTRDDGKDDSSGSDRTYQISKFFLGEPPPLEYLVLQLRGRQMWIELTAIRSQLNHLKKLFIANVPMNWDTFWILHLLAAAPALESLHVHFDSKSEKATAGSLDVQVEHHQQHHHLKELMVIGFDGVAWQTGFVKRIMRASPILERVHLLDGHVVEDEDRELVGLDIVRRRREWHECERLEVLEDLTDGIKYSPHLEIVLE
ncbi:uncharacterized protein LOC125510875 isoform X1 [Triticum urartu]|uniref:F-box domain-containing protein n=1 Tax=Triticum urartu TaxID=4572 RepID=A0A8R7UMA7_TRIUA|nr:uncharacterized protein LOC125510875 isoform X1 [Triticum urartu]XP_048532106.1 uncharacterized protein LOC125510875 isoform X1 [Triticum urartu]